MPPGHPILIAALLHPHPTHFVLLPTLHFSSVLLWPPGLHCPSRALQYFLPVLTLLSSVTAAAKSFIASTAGTDWLVSTKSQLDMSNTSLPCPLEPYVDQSEQSSLQRMWENLCLSPRMLLLSLSSYCHFLAYYNMCQLDSHLYPSSLLAILKQHPAWCFINLIQVLVLLCSKLSSGFPLTR